MPHAAAGLDHIVRNIKSEYDCGGILQFSLVSLAAGGQISENNIRKAVLLGRRSTLFAQYKIEYQNPAVDARYASSRPEASSARYFSYEAYIRDVESSRFDLAYIRQLFKYREAIARSALILLPRGIAPEGVRDHRDHSRKRGVFNSPIRIDKALLGAMTAGTRVIDASIDDSLINAVLQRYRLQRQLVILPQLQIPWVDNITLSQTLNLRDDHFDELDNFQRAYHEALLTQIDNFHSFAFKRHSKQINEDIIGPALRAIDRQYNRDISKHRSLRIAGATVAAIPIAQTLISAAAFRVPIASAEIEKGGEFATGLVSLWANRVARRSALETLKDNDFYVIWKLEKDRSAANDDRGSGTPPFMRIP